MEARKIGVWTEQVPPAALNKRRQEITSDPSQGGGEEVEEAEEEGEVGKEMKVEEGGVMDPQLGEGEGVEEAEEEEEGGKGEDIGQEEAEVVEEEMKEIGRCMHHSEERDGNLTRTAARVME
jgi:hypothetical protein